MYQHALVQVSAFILREHLRQAGFAVTKGLNRDDSPKRHVVLYVASIAVLSCTGRRYLPVRQCVWAISLSLAHENSIGVFSRVNRLN